MSFSKFATKAQVLNLSLIKDAMDDYHSWEIEGQDLQESDLLFVVNCSDEEWERFVKSNRLTRGGQFLGRLARKYKVWNPLNDRCRRRSEREYPIYLPLTMRELCAKMMAYKAIKSAVDQYGDEELPLPRNTMVYALIKLGVKFTAQADKFIQIYREYATPGRTFGSCYQPIQRMAVLATNPEYWCLPDHTIRGMIHGKFKIPNYFADGDRIGNVWDFIPAVKAWSLCPELPKKIAVRVGKMELWKRYAAMLAWNTPGICEIPEKADKVTAFWIAFNSECQKGPGNAIHVLLQPWEGKPATPMEYRLVETILGIDYKSLEGTERFAQVAKYLPAKEALQTLFGVSSKSLVQSWTKATPEAIQWASVIAPKGNIDWINKFLLVDNCIPYFSECVEFLNSLSPSRALAMLQTTTYKYRGEIRQLEDCHFKDTGMIFYQLKQKGFTPNVGRVRCWLTVHEELSRQYISVLPNEKVVLNSKWEAVNGLSAVDGSWRIELPTNTAQLKLWGEQLHNCVGGYGESINNGYCVVFVVYFHGALKYCVEVRHGEIKQFYGQRNSAPDYSERDAVLASLRDAKLIY